jgi:hypothetical protein
MNLQGQYKNKWTVHFLEISGAGASRGLLRPTDGYQLKAVLYGYIVPLML